jgi:hypothetical protein
MTFSIMTPALSIILSAVMLRVAFIIVMLGVIMFSVIMSVSLKQNPGP